MCSATRRFFRIQDIVFKWILIVCVKYGLSADTHTPLYLMVYFQGRFYSLLTSPSCPVTQEAIKCPEPLCTLKVLPLAPKCLALRQQTLLCLHRSYGLMRQS